MAIFGIGNRWDRSPFETPGYGDGMRQQVPQQQQPNPMRSELEPKQKKKSFWQGGDGFGWRDGVAGALAAIGDALSSNAGGQAWATQSLAGGRLSAIEAAKQAQAAEIEAQRKAEADWAKFQREHNYKRDNPMPVNNDTVNDYEWYKGLSEKDKRLYHQMRPQLIQIDNGDGTRTIVPYNPYGGPTPQQGGELPTFTEEDWNNAGGGTGNGVGGF